MRDDFEDLLRRYLTWLADPSTLVDEAAVARLEAAAADESDPVARLKLLSELERARQGADVDELQAAVVSDLAEWSEAQGITRGALEQLGVPATVLDRAGLRRAARRATGRGPKRGAPTGGTRAERLDPADVKRVITEQLGRTWKLADLAEAIDREPATARNHLTRLLAEGFVTEVGDDPAHEGRGRAPKLYARA